MGKRRDESRGSLSKEYQRRRGINMYTRYLHRKRGDDLRSRYRDDPRDRGRYLTSRSQIRRTEEPRGPSVFRLPSEFSPRSSGHILMHDHAPSAVDRCTVRVSTFLLHAFFHRRESSSPASRQGGQRRFAFGLPASIRFIPNTPRVRTQTRRKNNAGVVVEG